jgi:DDE superfamily endonuclease
MKLEQPSFLHPDLCIFGDNAYVNTKYMATPYRNISVGPKDSYNYYHSQVRINIECAFGMLCNHFGILRKTIPSQITAIAKTCELVLACCRLHNYCIDNNDDIPQSTDYDAMNISIEGGIPLTIEPNIGSRHDCRPVQLLGGHTNDFDRHTFCRRDKYHSRNSKKSNNKNSKKKKMKKCCQEKNYST